MSPNKCACGCGATIPEGSKYKRGHYAKAKAQGLLNSPQDPEITQFTIIKDLKDQGIINQDQINKAEEILKSRESPGSQNIEREIVNPVIMTKQEKYTNNGPQFNNEDEEAARFIANMVKNFDDEKKDPAKELETAKYIIHSVFDPLNLGSATNLSAEEIDDFATADYLNMVFKSPMIAKFKHSYMTYKRSETTAPRNILSGFFDALHLTSDTQGPGRLEKFINMFKRGA